METIALLAKERTIAGPGFNRWLVPPAALAIHLCIGMAYGFSVFWKPLGQALLDADGKPLKGEEVATSPSALMTHLMPFTIRATIDQRKLDAFLIRLATSVMHGGE